MDKMSAYSNPLEATNYENTIAQLEDCRIHLLTTHSEDAAYDESLANLIQSISLNVNKIEKESHHALLESIFDGITRGKGLSPWFLFRRSRSALLELVSHFIASGVLSTMAVEFLVCSFCPPLGTDIDKEKCTAAHIQEILLDIFHAVEASLKLAPTIYEELVGFIMARMPHKYTDLLRSQCYASMVFRLSRGPLRHAGDRLFIRLTERLVELDNEIKWEEIPQVNVHYLPCGAHEEEDMNSEKNVKEGNMDELDEADVFEISTVHEEDVQKKWVRNEAKWKKEKGQKMLCKYYQNDPNAEKIDHLVSMALQYIKSVNDENIGHIVHDALLSAFQGAIFPVQKARISQFLVFYSCSRNPGCTRLIGFLSSVFLSNQYPEKTRINAVWYISSFVARATFLNLGAAFETLQIISMWCVQFCKNHSASMHYARADMQYADLFAAALQGLMYAFCALASSIRRITREIKNDIRCLRLGEICQHCSNPLSKCSSALVEDFLVQAVQLNVISDESARKLHIMNESQSRHSQNAFHPFDLHSLKLSSDFICKSGSYRIDFMTDRALDMDNTRVKSEPKHSSFNIDRKEESYLSESPSAGFGESYQSEEEGDYHMSVQDGGNSDVIRQAWFQVNQRPVPIGMKAKEILYTKCVDGISGSPAIMGSMSTDPSPDVLAMSLGASFNDVGKAFPNKKLSFSKQ